MKGACLPCCALCCQEGLQRDLGGDVAIALNAWHVAAFKQGCHTLVGQCTVHTHLHPTSDTGPSHHPALFPNSCHGTTLTCFREGVKCAWNDVLRLRLCTAPVFGRGAHPNTIWLGLNHLKRVLVLALGATVHRQQNWRSLPAIVYPST